MTAEEFNKLLDDFGRECGKLGASDPGLCFDPYRNEYVRRVNEMRVKLKDAFREALHNDDS